MAHNLLFKTPTNKGLTYIEILAGIAIISFIIVGMNSIFSIGIRNNKKAENIVIVLNEAQGLMEQELAKDFNGVQSHEYVDVIYVEETNFNQKADITTRAKRITITVSGPDITDVELTSVIVDPVVSTP